MTTRRAQTNFTADDMGRPPILKSIKDGQPPVTPTINETVPQQPVTEPVPEGTAKDILAWVGNDREKADRALAAEESSEDPRKVLVATLHKMTGRTSRAAVTVPSVPPSVPPVPAADKPTE